MSQEVIEITEREIEVIEVVEKGPAGPIGPQANINYTVVSSPQTLSNSQNIAADTSGGSFTLTLPASPNAGDSIDIFDYSETFDTNPLTIARNGENIESIAEDLICNVEGAYFTMIYTGATRGWQILPRYGTTGGGGESVLTTEGDMVYRGAAINERLPIGSAGQILKVNSGGNAPEWGAAPATGVTSVGVTGSDGIEVDSGSPVTGSGTIALGVNAATLRSHINVADGAEANVNADWNASSGDAQILNKPTLSTVATSGDYDDLSNKPASFTPTAHASSHYTGGSDALAPSDIGAAAASHNHPATDITSGTLAHERGGLEADVSAYDGLVKISGGSTSAVTVTSAGEALLDDADAAAQRTTLGLGTAATVDADQNLNTTDIVTFQNVTATGDIETQGVCNAFSLSVDQGKFFIDASASEIECNLPLAFDPNVLVETRTNLGLGTAAVEDTTAFAAPADIPDASTATPQALGSAAAGTSEDYSRADHVHAAPAINDLSNVSAAAPSDNDVLVYDNATSTWVAEAPAASGIAETLLDAKGDLIVASAADTAARLAVGGTDGHVLTVDSNETLGVKWAAASASNMTGATSSVAGTAGLVPQPAAGKEEMALLGSGEFHVPFVPIIKTETTRGAANTKRWLVAPLCETAAAGSSGGANYEFCGGYVYIPYTGSFYYATVPASLYTTNTKTYWGLYNLASDGLPGTLAYDLGELDVGAGSGVICESANSISLNKGWYCCVSRANGTFNLWSPQSAQWLDHILGKYSPTVSSLKRRFYRSLTYSTSLSSDLTSTTWTEGSATAPNLFFRRA